MSLNSYRNSAAAPCGMPPIQRRRDVWAGSLSAQGDTTDDLIRQGGGDLIPTPPSGRWICGLFVHGRADLCVTVRYGAGGHGPALRVFDRVEVGILSTNVHSDARIRKKSNSGADPTGAGPAPHRHLRHRLPGRGPAGRCHHSGAGEVLIPCAVFPLFVRSIRDVDGAYAHSLLIVPEAQSGSTMTYDAGVGTPKAPRCSITAAWSWQEVQSEFGGRVQSERKPGTKIKEVTKVEKVTCALPRTPALPVWPWWACSTNLVSPSRCSIF